MKVQVINSHKSGRICQKSFSKLLKFNFSLEFKTIFNTLDSTVFLFQVNNDFVFIKINLFEHFFDADALSKKRQYIQNSSIQVPLCVNCNFLFSFLVYQRKEEKFKQNRPQVGFDMDQFMVLSHWSQIQNTQLFCFSDNHSAQMFPGGSRQTENTLYNASNANLIKLTLTLYIHIHIIIQFQFTCQIQKSISYNCVLILFLVIKLFIIKNSGHYNSIYNCVYRVMCSAQ